MTKLLVDLFRPCGNSTLVMEFVGRALEDNDMIEDPNCKDFMDEVVLLGALSKPWDAGLTLEALDTAKRAFVPSKHMSLHKCVTVLPTGTELLHDADVAIKRRSADMAVLTKLDGIMNLMASLLAVNVDAVMDNGAIILPEPCGWKDALDGYTSVLASASPLFQSTHKDNLFKVSAALMAAANVLTEASTTRFQSSAALMFAKLAHVIMKGPTYQQKGLNQAMSAANALINKCAELCPSAEELGLGNLVPPHHDIYVTYDTEVGVWKSLIATCSSALRPLAERSLDVTSDLAARLSAVLSAPPHIVASDKDFKDYAQRTVHGLAMCTSTVLKECLPQPLFPFVRLLCGAWHRDHYDTLGRQLLDSIGCHNAVLPVFNSLDSLAQSLRTSGLGKVLAHGGGVCLPGTDESVPVGKLCITITSFELTCKVFHDVVSVSEADWLACSSTTFTELKAIWTMIDDYATYAKAMRDVDMVEDDGPVDPFAEYLLDLLKQRVDHIIDKLATGCTTVAGMMVAWLQTFDELGWQAFVDGDLSDGACRISLLAVVTGDVARKFYSEHKLLRQLHSIKRNHVGLVYGLATPSAAQGYEQAFHKLQEVTQKIIDWVQTLTVLQALLRPLNPGETCAALWLTVPRPLFRPHAVT